MPSYFYIGIQAYAIIIGIIHVWQMGKRFGWRNQESLTEKLILSVCILLVAMLVQASIIYLIKDVRGFYYLFPTSLLFFLYPLLAISVFDFAINIPVAIYKTWKYPENMNMPDMDLIDFSNSYIVTFELKKNARNPVSTTMKFKAPQDRLTFGDLFYFYMFEYNEKNRESQIQYLDDYNRAFEWMFYVKPAKWWQSKRYIDHSLTVRENKIKENFVIVSERV